MPMIRPCFFDMGCVPLLWKDQGSVAPPPWPNLALVSETHTGLSMSGQAHQMKQYHSYKVSPKWCALATRTTLPCSFVPESDVLGNRVRDSGGQWVGNCKPPHCNGLTPAHNNMICFLCTHQQGFAQG